MKKICSCIALLFFINTFLLCQNSLTWYSPDSDIDSKDIFLTKTGDCELIKEGFDSKMKVDIIEYDSRPFFIHTIEEFKKWMDGRFLVEASANIYKADKSTFLLLDLKINSQNARDSYGKLEFKTKLKCFLENGEHIYLENVERSKGTVNRKQNYTLYNPVFALDNFEIKTLRKYRITKVGLIWEEGYQEYDVQNMELIQNQLKCLEDL